MAQENGNLESQLFEAKCHLYSLLLKKGAENWTKAEVDICFHLSMDEQIQAFLADSLPKQQSAE